MLKFITSLSSLSFLLVPLFFLIIHIPLLKYLSLYSYELDLTLFLKDRTNSFPSSANLLNKLMSLGLLLFSPYLSTSFKVIYLRTIY